MTSTATTTGFSAAEFTELRCAIGNLHREWFPQWDGVHPADMPTAARFAQDDHRLITMVVARDGVSHLAKR